MRIIGGRARGLRLAPVGDGDQAAHLRPTSDRVREAIFNLLINGKAARHGDLVGNARVLDLFAGTGALGLEALSRGAKHVTFVENGKISLGLIRRNIDLMQAGEATTLFPGNAASLPPNREAGFDLVFMDPPYGKDLGQAALAACAGGKWLSSKALIVWEEGTAPTPPAGFDLIDQRRYGDTFVTLLKVRI